MDRVPTWFVIVTALLTLAILIEVVLLDGATRNDSASTSDRSGFTSDSGVGGRP